MAGPALGSALSALPQRVHAVCAASQGHVLCGDTGPPSRIFRSGTHHRQPHSPWRGWKPSISRILRLTFPFVEVGSKHTTNSPVLPAWKNPQRP